MLAPVRQLTRRFAPEGEAEVLPLIVTELLSNAYDVATGDVDFRLERDGDTVTVTVIDDGPGFDPSAHVEQPDPTGLGGRGVPIDLELAHRFSVERADDRTVVTATIAFSDGAPTRSLG